MTLVPFKLIFMLTCYVSAQSPREPTLTATDVNLVILISLATTTSVICLLILVLCLAIVQKQKRQKKKRKQDEEWKLADVKAIVNQFKKKQAESNTSQPAELPMTNTKPASSNAPVPVRVRVHPLFTALRPLSGVH